MAVSLRLVLALIISVVAIVAAVVAFVPTYLTGVSALRSTMTDLRNSYVNRAQEGVTSFFDIPIGALLEVENMISTGMVDLSDTAKLLKFAGNVAMRYPQSTNGATWDLFAAPVPVTPYYSIDTRFLGLYGPLLVSFKLLCQRVPVQHNHRPHPSSRTGIDVSTNGYQLVRLSCPTHCTPAPDSACPMVRCLDGGTTQFRTLPTYASSTGLVCSSEPLPWR